MSYGSTFQPPKLSKDLIAAVAKKGGTGLIEFFRQLLTIGGLLLSFTGLGVAEELAAQLIVSGAQEAIDESTGSTSVLTTAINFGAPLIGAKFAVNQNLINVGKASKSVNKLRNIGTRFSKASAEERKGILDTLTKAGILKEGAGAKEVEAINNLATQASFVIWKNGSKSFTSANYGVEGIVGKTISQFSNEAIKSEIAIASTFGTQDLDRMLESVREISNEGLDESIKIAVEGREKLAEIGFNENEVNVLSNIINDTSLTSAQKYSSSLGFIRSISIESRGLEFARFKQVMAETESSINEALQLPIAREFKNEITSLYPELEIKDLRKSFNKSSRSSKKKLRDVLRNPSSAAFNDRIVQPTQALFDPNDAGRAPIEFLYRKIKNKITKSISAISKNLGKAERIEDAYVKAGGVILDSVPMLGYKVISELNPEQICIEISFRPEATNGKPPVFVWATPLQLEKLIVGTMNYYLKHFAYSRGGRSLRLGGSINAAVGAKVITKESEFLLSYLNTNALRNIFSLLSNVVENSATAAQGKYFGTWQTKFTDSFKRAGINRTFRLFGRVIVGGGVSAKYGKAVGSFIGRELQRVGTTVGAPVVKNAFHRIKLENKLYNNTITKGELRQLNNLNSNGITSGITKGTLLNAFASSVQSNIRRQLRIRRPNSVAIHARTATRKLQIVGRTPNTILPKRPFKGIKIN